jgi:hypothetical protein
MAFAERFFLIHYYLLNIIFLSAFGINFSAQFYFVGSSLFIFYLPFILYKFIAEIKQQYVGHVIDSLP